MTDYQDSLEKLALIKRLSTIKPTEELTEEEENLIFKKYQGNIGAIQRLYIYYQRSV